MTQDLLALRGLLDATPEPASRSGRLDGGRRCGRWRSWRADGSLLVEATFRRGVRHGAWIRWHPNGEVAVRMAYHRGLAEGVLQAWYPHGVTALRAELSGGRLHGRFATWRCDGSPWATGSCLAGLPRIERARAGG